MLAESRNAPKPTRHSRSRIFTRTRVHPIPNNRVKVTTLQTNKDSEGVVHGHGPSTGLRACQQTESSVFHNRVSTGLFMTRLQPKTSVQNIQGHLLKETGQKLHAVNSRSSLIRIDLFMSCVKSMY